MDRLTWRRDDGEVCPRIPVGTDPIYILGEFTARVYNRLAAYEDTGLTPEEVAELAAARKAGRSGPVS